MVDYCLFMILLNEQLNKITFLGEDFLLHSKINSLLQTKNIKTADDGCLIIINKESPQFIDFYWRNILSNQIKWLIITPRNITEAVIIYKEIRSFGDAILIQSEEPVIIIKNFKENFKDFFRQEILLPLDNKNINEFLNCSDEMQSLSMCSISTGNKEQQIIESLLSNSMYIYFGEKVPLSSLLLCQKLANMKFYIIELVNKENFERLGFFVHRDYLEKTIIYSLSNLKSLENVFKFHEIKLTIPV